MEDKFKNHPYHDDFGIIKAAFDLLLTEQKHNFEVLRGYKKSLTDDAVEQMYWEDNRIIEVKKKILNLYHKNLTKQNES